MGAAILVTGCSAGGKSTLIAALRAAGERVVPEPGRRIVGEERERGGRALPWIDPVAFAHRAVAMAHGDLADHARIGGRAFFDRGLVDAALALEHVAGVPAGDTLARAPRYGRCVFVTPPWRALFSNDGARRHGFDAALAEHGRIVAALPRLGYEGVTLPRLGIAERVAFVLARCATSADLQRRAPA